MIPNPRSAAFYFRRNCRIEFIRKSVCLQLALGNCADTRWVQQIGAWTPWLLSFPGFPFKGSSQTSKFEQNLSQQPFRTMMGFALLLQGRGDSGEKVRALQLGQDYKESDSSSEQI
jgi:hypothetical protein